MFETGECLKLISLDLTNYRRFRRATLEFPEGVIGILGLNGVGKSTIIEAIAWALYGNQPTIVRTQKEHLKCFSAPPSEVCEVGLSFELDGDKYLVTRKMAGKNFSTTAEIVVNGIAVATTTKAVTDLIEAKLGMDYQAFYTSVFAKQKELNALSTLDPNKRKKLILRMLNIDSIDKAIIAIRRDGRDYNTRLKELRSILFAEDGTPRIESAKNNTQDLEVKISEIKNNIAGLETKKIGINTVLKELEAKRSEQRRLKDEFNKLNNKLTEINSSLKTTNRQKEKLEGELKSLEKQSEELNSLEPKRSEWEIVRKRKSELEELHSKFIHARELREQLKQIEDTIKTQEEHLKKLVEDMKRFEGLDAQVKTSEDSLAKNRNETEALNKKISEYKSKVGLMNDEIKKLEGKLKDIQSLGPGSECPTCERVLGDHYIGLEEKFKQELTEKTKNRRDLGREIEDEQQLLEDAKKRQDALVKKEKYLASLEKDFARVEEKVKNTESDLSSNEAKKEKLCSELAKISEVKFDQEEFDNLKDRYNELEKIHERIIGLSSNVEKMPDCKKEFAEQIELLKGLNEDKNLLESQIRDLGFDQIILDDLENKFDAQSKLLRDLELAIKEKESEIKIHNKEIEKLAELIKELEEHEKKVIGYEDMLIYLTKLDSILNKFKSYMISRISPTLTQYASDLFRDLTDGKYNRMEVDNDYNVSIFDQGEEFPMSRFSGGEEDLANLCLRLAISQVITAQAGTTGPGFVILDEIFGSQDLHRKRNLLQTLNGLTNRFRQIFLITHIEDVKDYIEYNIIVTEKDNQTSSVQVIG